MSNQELTPPEEPAEWECCNADCGDACTWQIYYREKREYEEALKQHTQTTSQNNEPEK